MPYRRGANVPYRRGANVSLQFKYLSKSNYKFDIMHDFYDLFKLGHDCVCLDAIEASIDAASLNIRPIISVNQPDGMDFIVTFLGRKTIFRCTKKYIIDMLYKTLDVYDPQWYKKEECVFKYDGTNELNLITVLFGEICVAQIDMPAIQHFPSNHDLMT